MHPWGGGDGGQDRTRRAAAEPRPMGLARNRGGRGATDNFRNGGRARTGLFGAPHGLDSTGTMGMLQRGGGGGGTGHKGVYDWEGGGTPLGSMAHCAALGQGCSGGIQSKGACGGWGIQTKRTVEASRGRGRGGKCRRRGGGGVSVSSPASCS